MSNISEIVLRRLDGVYLESSLSSASLKPQDLCLIRLLGYNLSTEVQSAFEKAAQKSRDNLIFALLAKMPDFMAARVRRKAASCSTYSQLDELTADLPDGKQLEVVSESAVQELFQRLVTQPLPYSEQDKLDLVILAARFDIRDMQAAARENNAILAGLIPDYDWTRSMTITDALRVAAVWSGGDPTLATPTRFKLPRSKRRALAYALDSVIEKSDYAFFDMARHREPWKRLLSAIHAQDYKTPSLHSAAGLLFSGDLTSIDAIIEYLIRAGDYNGLLVHLKTMPGVFARRLNELIRKFPDRRDEILADFTDVSSRVSTRVLIQLRNHFNGPTRAEAPNVPFAGKSRTARNGLIENRNSGDNEDIIEAIDVGLSEKLAGKKVYIDGGDGDRIGVMTANRSGAIGSRSVAPGSRVAIENDSKFLTLFTHWKNIGEGNTVFNRVDLDLSGLFISKDLQNSEHLAYYSTQSAHARYSGDITEAPNGAEEYIVVDVEHAKKRGFRYMAIVINSYTGQSVATIPECYAGVATASKLEFGDFDASKVETRFDLMAEGCEVIPFLVDFETMELIWTDMAFKGARMGANMSESSNLGSVLKYMVNYRGITVDQLVEKTGGVRVDSPEDADIKIDPRMSDQVAQLLV